MRSIRIFILGLFIYLSIGISVGCQSRQTYTSQQLRLTINYPDDWEFLGEDDGLINLRSYYDGDATITITSLGTALANTDLNAVMQEQQNYWIQQSDPNKPIELGEIQEREHKEYLIFTGRVSGYSRIKVAPVDFFFHVYIAAIQFQDRIAIVTVGGTGHKAQQNAIDEIIKGLEFR